MGRLYAVYMLASSKKGVIYTGITSNLIKRTWEHKNEIVEGFTQKYKVKKLVYFEVHDDPEEAIKREKKLKRWRREWKIKLIEENNPKWKDLYDEL